MKSAMYIGLAALCLVLTSLSLSAQSFEDDKIRYLEGRMADAFDEEERLDIREQIEQLREQKNQKIINTEDRNDLTFERRLDQIRGVMVDRDEQAVVGMAHVKLDKALYGFLQTDFMKEYKSLKLEAESLAATFKAQATQIPPADVAKVKRGYTRVAEDFNRFLIEMKRDFMDKKKLKLIRTNREMYANSLQYKLRDLKDSYSQDFERVVAEVTGSDMYAAVPLAAIFGLIKLAKDFTEFIVRSNYEARRVKEEHLNSYLVEPYRFRDWFEIEILEGDLYNSYEANDNFNEFQQEEENYEDFEEMDPFEYDVDAPSLSRKRKKN